jgi:hypothetical protein
MAKMWTRLLAPAAVAFLGLYAAPAMAQGQTRSWVSATGDNANPCTEAQPCRTFQRAINRTIDGGEVNCLNAGAFGGAIITKSISIICDGNEAGIIGNAQGGFLIGGPPDMIVTISGIDFEGLGQSASPGDFGLAFASGAALHIRNSKFRGFRGGYAIFFVPSTDSKLMMDNVSVTESGCGCVDSGGIGIYPGPDVHVRATILNTQAFNNDTAGLHIDTTQVTGASVNVTIANSVFAHNVAGILVKSPAGSGTSTVALINSIVTQNTGFGIIVNGPGITGRVDGSKITGNGTGVLINGGATLASYGNNMVIGNDIENAFTGTALKPR